MTQAIPKPGDVVDLWDVDSDCVARLHAMGPGTGFNYEVKVYLLGFDPQYSHQRIKIDGEIYGEIGSTYTWTKRGARWYSRRCLRSARAYRRRYAS